MNLTNLYLRENTMRMLLICELFILQAAANRGDGLHTWLSGPQTGQASCHGGGEAASTRR